jgi:hypothetical protein
MKMGGAWVGLALGVLGLIVPVALWIADRDHHALSATVVSRADLQPQLTGTVPSSVGILVNGRTAVEPYLIVVEIENKGSRPITTRDFETPLTVNFKPAQVLEARAADAQPSSLRPRTGMAGSTVAILPLLLNPGDKFRVTALTGGAVPRITTHARIADISAIEVIDNTEGTKRRRSAVSMFLVAVLFPAYAALWMTFWLPQKYTLRGWAKALTALACAAAATVLCVEFLPAERDWARISLLALLAGGGTVIGLLFVKRTPRSGRQ